MADAWTRGDYTISCDPGRLDLDEIHSFLTSSYWATGISRDLVARSIAGSLPFGLYHGPTGRLVGFARVISDRATFAYLGDVFVLESHRRLGLGHWLVEVITGHPELQGLRRWLLATRDAHAIYAKFGFTPIENPERLMHRWRPNFYQQNSKSAQ